MVGGEVAGDPGLQEGFDRREDGDGERGGVEPSCTSLFEGAEGDEQLGVGGKGAGAEAADLVACCPAQFLELESYEALVGREGLDEAAKAGSCARLDVVSGCVRRRANGGDEYRVDAFVDGDEQRLQRVEVLVEIALGETTLA